MKATASVKIDLVAIYYCSHLISWTEKTIYGEPATRRIPLDWQSACTADSSLQVTKKFDCAYCWIGCELWPRFDLTLLISLKAISILCDHPRVAYDKASSQFWLSTTPSLGTDFPPGRPNNLHAMSPFLLPVHPRNTDALFCNPICSLPCLAFKEAQTLIYKF